MNPQATSRLRGMRVSKPSLVTKTISTLPGYKDTRATWPSAKCLNTGIGDSASPTETNCSPFEEKRNVSKPINDYGDDSTDVASITTTEAGGTTAAGFNDHTFGLSKAEARYKCVTQTCGCTEVRIGNGRYISRWPRNSVLRYIVDDKSFPTPAAAMRVRAAMQQAIHMWKATCVSFEEVYCDNSATFVVLYPQCGRRNAYASSFFPDESPGELLVYKLSLSNATYLPNILAHEIGHILGLRHEFAHKDKEEQKHLCVLLGKGNPRSIMNYYDDLRLLQVSEQDLMELEKFYAYDGEEYEGLPMYEYDPNLHSRISRRETRSSHAMGSLGRRFSCRRVMRKMNSLFLAALHSAK